MSEERDFFMSGVGKIEQLTVGKFDAAYAEMKRQNMEELQKENAALRAEVEKAKNFMGEAVAGKLKDHDTIMDLRAALVEANKRLKCHMKSETDSDEWKYRRDFYALGPVPVPGEE